MRIMTAGVMFHSLASFRELRHLVPIRTSHTLYPKISFLLNMRISRDNDLVNTVYSTFLHDIFLRYPRSSCTTLGHFHVIQTNPQWSRSNIENVLLSMRDSGCHWMSLCANLVLDNS